MSDSAEKFIDPAEMDADFQALLIRLEHPGSSRRELRIVEVFVSRYSSFEDGVRSLIPNLLEISDRLYRIALNLDPAGIPVPVLDSLIDVLVACSKNIDDRGIPSVFGKTINLLQDARAASVFLLANRKTTSDNSSLTERVIEPNMVLLRLEKTWNDASASSSGTGHLITVGLVDSVPFGILRTCHLEIFSESDSDSFRLNAPSIAEQSDDDSALDSAIQQGRKFLVRSNTNDFSTGYTGRVTVRGDSTVHHGHSGDLLIAALFICSVSKRTGQRNRLKIASGVLMTGVLKDDGIVCGVDKNTFKAKVETAFYSWASILVVPAEQINEARTVVSALSADYSDRELVIHGVSKLDDLFADRRLIEEERLGLVHYVKIKAKKRRATLALGVAILSLVALGFVLFPLLNTVPHSVALAGDGISVLNSDGRVLDHVELGSGLQNLDPGRLSSIAILVDLDGDGEKELIWAEAPGTSSGTPGRIQAKNIGEPGTIWQTQLRLENVYSNDASVAHGRFKPNWIGIDDVDGDGKPDLIASLAHEELYPGAVVRIDILSGEIIATYHHSGVIQDILLSDFDDDGVKEIVLTGTNNAYRQAIIAVLDSRSLSGYGPATGKYLSPNRMESPEIFYARLPISRLGDAHPATVVTGQFIKENKDDRQFIVLTTEANFPARFESPLKAGYGITMGFDLIPRSIQTSSGYDLTYVKALKEGTISEPLTEDYLQSLIDEILYWDGKEWTTEFTLVVR